MTKRSFIPAAFAIVAAALLCADSAEGAASPYLFFENFENGTPTSPDWFIPPTSTPSGTSGVTTSPDGGSRYGFVGAGFPFNDCKWTTPSPAFLAAGSWSFQVDYFPRVGDDVRFTAFGVQNVNTNAAYMAGFTALVQSPAPAGKIFLSDYYSNYHVTLSLQKWYTFEWAFVPGTTVDPATGRVYVDYVLNIFQNGHTNANGYRSADLVAAYKGILNYTDYGGIRLSEPTSRPGYFEIQNATSTATSIIDNVAVGPMINTPEPATTTAALVAAAAVAFSRRRRRVDSSL